MNSATNLDSSYLQAHAEIEHEATPPDTAFEKRWAAFVKASKHGLWLDTDKNLASAFYQLGQLDEMASTLNRLNASLKP